MKRKASWLLQGIQVCLFSAWVTSSGSASRQGWSVRGRKRKQDQVSMLPSCIPGLQLGQGQGCLRLLPKDKNQNSLFWVFCAPKKWGSARLGEKHDRSALSGCCCAQLAGSSSLGSSSPIGQCICSRLVLHLYYASFHRERAQGTSSSASCLPQG